MELRSPGMFAVAMVAVGLTCLLAVTRGISLDRLSRFFVLGALILLALTAGEAQWRRPATGIVNVMVDLSPSTRGATYRNRSSLDRRVRELLGNTPYRLQAFAQSAAALPSGSTLNDLPAEKTFFAAPAADPVLLFSDGRFDLPPAAPPTYPVIDPALETTGDAAVMRLEMRNQKCIAAISNDGAPRKLSWSGAISGSDEAITSAQIRVATPGDETKVVAALSAGDLWPENDSLSIIPAPPPILERWWIGSRDPGPTWRRMSAEQLPTDAASFLATGVIVLDNLSADSLSSIQLDRLAQYSRDLGGGIVILGGDKAFAAGGYDGTLLESISPLSSSPPAPAWHWIMVFDASGSMASDTGAGTRWQVEMASVARLLPALASNDLVSIGSFSDGISWWSRNTSARDTAAMALPPPGAFPHGPTGLASALRDAVAAADSAMPIQLFVMTDAEAELTDMAAIAQLFNSKHARLNVLATGDGAALAALRSLVKLTGGKIVEQFNPQQWISSSGELLRAARPNGLEHHPVSVRFENELRATGVQQVDQWNRTWLKPQASPLAETPEAPMAADWRVGIGRVAAVAFLPDMTTAGRLAELFTAPPHDPRFSVSWRSGPGLHITVDAIAGGTYLNDQNIWLDWSSSAAASEQPPSQKVPQTAPGRYELEIPAPRRQAIAMVRCGDSVIDRFAVADRYAPEFNAIGNDRQNLQALADRTGGEVIPPERAKRIDWHWPQRQIPLSPWLAAASAVVIGASAVRWKSRRQ